MSKISDRWASIAAAGTKETEQWPTRSFGRGTVPESWPSWGAFRASADD